MAPLLVLEPKPLEARESFKEAKDSLIFRDFKQKGDCTLTREVSLNGFSVYKNEDTRFEDVKFTSGMEVLNTSNTLCHPEGSKIKCPRSFHNQMHSHLGDIYLLKFDDLFLSFSPTFNVSFPL